MFKRLVVLLIIAGILLAGVPSALADDPPAAPQATEDYIYTVQAGDSLILIALKYNLRLADIIVANDLVNPSLIFPGQKLILPGLSAPPAPSNEQPALRANSHIVQPGETISLIAAGYGLTVEDLVRVNNLTDVNVLEVGQALRLPLAGPAVPQAPFSPPFANVQISEPAIVQGRTLIVRVTLTEPAALGGLFEDQPVFFFSSGGNQFWGLVPIHALAEPKIYSLSLNATLQDGQTVSRIESINVVGGPYDSETINLTGNRADLLQAELVAQEQEMMVTLWSRITPQPLWQGPFRYPVAGTSPRVTSAFGTRRTYNDSPELSFHGGADFGGGVGTPIYAPAPGKVVLAQPLTVRGQAVLIDHGLGLFSGYWHQSEIMVVEGQEVQAGEIIGLIGNTGLSTGPHLHWELRLNGIAVNPLQWVKETIP